MIQPIKVRKIDANAEDFDLIDFDSQKELHMQNQLQRDKIRAVKRIAEKINHKKTVVKKAAGDDKERMEKELAQLEEEQFDLLRDEILNACKDSAGLLNIEKLKKVPSSSAFIEKNLSRKQKPKTNRREK